MQTVQDFKSKGHYDKVKLWPNHDVVHVVPSQTMSLPSINFLHLRFLRYNPLKMSKLKVPVKSMSHHGVALLHPQPMSPPSINFLHFTISEIQQINYFPPFACLPACPSDSIYENNISAVFKCCGGKNVRYFLKFMSFIALTKY